MLPFFVTMPFSYHLVRSGLVAFAEEPSAWEFSPHKADLSKDKPQAIKLFLLRIPKSMFLMRHTSLVSPP